MDLFVPYSEVFLAAVIHATLQLELGALLLLYHSSIGKHVRKKTKFLVSNYITGIGMLILLLLGAIAFGFDRYFGGPLYPEEVVIVVFLLLALAVATWLFYYRRGRSTELWLPRSVARFIDRRAKVTESNTEAFSLGLLTGLAEMPFALILLVVAANSLLSLPIQHQLLAIALYTIIAILPSVILRVAIRKGQTVAEIQRWRVKHKTFFRILTAIGFFVLGCFLFSFEVLA